MSGYGDGEETDGLTRVEAEKTRCEKTLVSIRGTAAIGNGGIG